MNKKVVTGILMIALMLFGCGPSLHVEDITDQNNSLVFGYIDVRCMSWVQLQSAGGQKGQSLITIKRVEDGLFYMENIPPASYQILRFGCGGTPHGKTGITYGPGGSLVFNFPQYGKNETAIRITNPGILFMGAYEYEKVKTGFFEDEKFNIKKSGSPSERQLLDRLQKYTEDTRWHEMVRKRMEVVR